MYGFAIEILRANLENCKKIKDEVLEVYRLNNDRMAMLGAMMAYEAQVADISDAIETLKSIADEMAKDEKEADAEFGDEKNVRDGQEGNDILESGKEESHEGGDDA